VNVWTSDERLPNNLALMTGHTAIDRAPAPRRYLRLPSPRLGPQHLKPQHLKPGFVRRRFYDEGSPRCSAASLSLHSSGDLPGDGNGALATVEELIAGTRKKRTGNPTPPQLPPTPRTATLGDVLPYLARLALGEAQLYWRVAGALFALVM